MRSLLWPITYYGLLVLAAIGLGLLFGNALETQFYFFPGPPDTATRQIVTWLANLICLAPLLVILLSTLATRRFSWQGLALAFFLPIFVVFATVTLV